MSRRSRRAAIQQILRGLPTHHGVGHSIGVALVLVANLADTAGDLDTLRLLYDVRGLVGRRVQIGSGSEGHAVALRERLSADAFGGMSGGTADVRMDAINDTSLVAEARLDPLAMRNRFSRTYHPLGGDLVFFSSAFGRSRRSRWWNVLELKTRQTTWLRAGLVRRAGRGSHHGTPRSICHGLLYEGALTDGQLLRSTDVDTRGRRSADLSLQHVADASEANVSVAIRTCWDESLVRNF